MGEVRAADGRARRHRDDTTASGHATQHRLRRREDAEQIDIQHEAEVVHGDVFKRPRLVYPGNADECSDLRIVRHRPGDRRLVPHIDRMDGDVVAARSQVVQPLAVAIGRSHVKPVFDKAQYGRPAYARRTASDESDRPRLHLKPPRRS
ncbi:hypothetical protein CHELA40_10514 [Chelatococcus asaccharovorans]|nr:hypothetical protein CHELA40_10514 [Chelatococcus asaccharovorans]